MFTVRLAGNGHGFAVAVLALAMPLYHPNVAATVLRISLNSGAQKAILNFKKIIIGQLTVTGFQICSCVERFIKIGSRFLPPDLHNC